MFLLRLRYALFSFSTVNWYALCKCAGLCSCANVIFNAGLCVLLIRLCCSGNNAVVMCCAGRRAGLYDALCLYALMPRVFYWCANVCVVSSSHALLMLCFNVRGVSYALVRCAVSYALIATLTVHCATLLCAVYAVLYALCYALCYVIVQHCGFDMRYSLFCAS
jgi:hypothetical protein